MTSTFATKQDLKTTELALRQDTRRLEKKMDKRFEQVDKRFEQVDKRFEQVDKRFDELSQRLEDRFDKMMELSHLNAMESMRFIDEKFDKQADRIENIERAHHMLRIKVADNTAEISKLKRASK